MTILRKHLPHKVRAHEATLRKMRHGSIQANHVLDHSVKGFTRILERDYLLGVNVLYLQIHGNASILQRFRIMEMEAIKLYHFRGLIFVCKDADLKLV